MGAYKYETATYMRALAADEFLPAVLAAAQRLAVTLTSSTPSSGAAPGATPDPDSLAGLGSGGRGAGGGGFRNRGAGAAAAAAAAGVGGSHMLGPGSGGHGGAAGGAVVGITRKILRKGSRITQALKGMVGSSPKIYNQVGGTAGGGAVGALRSAATGRKRSCAWARDGYKALVG